MPGAPTHHQLPGLAPHSRQMGRVVRTCQILQAIRIFRTRRILRTRRVPAISPVTFVLTPQSQPMGRPAFCHVIRLLSTHAAGPLHRHQQRPVSAGFHQFLQCPTRHRHTPLRRHIIHRFAAAIHHAAASVIRQGLEPVENELHQPQTFRCEAVHAVGEGKVFAVRVVSLRQYVHGELAHVLHHIHLFRSETEGDGVLMEAQHQGRLQDDLPVELRFRHRCRPPPGLLFQQLLHKCAGGLLRFHWLLRFDGLFRFGRSPRHRRLFFYINIVRQPLRLRYGFPFLVRFIRPVQLLLHLPVRIHQRHCHTVLAHPGVILESQALTAIRAHLIDKNRILHLHIIHLAVAAPHPGRHQIPAVRTASPAVLLLPLHLKIQNPLL